MGATRRVVLTTTAAAMGWCAGWAAVSMGRPFAIQHHYPFLARSFPPPHHTPRYPDGLSFRFAMAHDVIHERFAKHGPAYYQERNRLAREQLEGLDPDSARAFELMDDLGAGLERLGRSDEAVAVLRGKLARQEAKGFKGRDLYTSYANLGTFLIHGAFKQAAAGDAQARERFREGVELVRRSVEVNPEAHFGRERWQAAIAEFLLAAMADPNLLKTFDCIGDRLDLKIGELLAGEGFRPGTGYGRPYDVEIGLGENPGPPRPPQGHPPTGDEAIRRHITKVGAEKGWEGVDVPSHREPAPFDEPTLGIIGMWRQGGGANPHFALALGEIMLRVGQRFIAWDAYERASRLADRYSTDPAARALLKEHCRKRQADIERSLAADSRAPTDLRAAFDAELAYGEGYQKDYQAYEASRIAAGASIADEHFYDEFPRRGEAVASASGTEERVVRVPKEDIHEYLDRRARAVGLLWAGLAAMTTAGLLRLAAWRRALKKPAPAEI